MADEPASAAEHARATQVAEVGEGKRPLTVTIVAILVWAQGVLWVAVGMYILMNLGDPDLVERAGGIDLARPLAIAAFAVALTLLGASGGILRGNRVASIVITVLMTVSIVLAGYVISGGERILGGTLIAAVAVASLILLWIPRSSAFFPWRDSAPVTRDRT